MFGNRFAFQFQGGGEESHTPHFERAHWHGGRNAWGNEWTPPWMREGWRGPRFFEMRRGRGPFGHGGPFGPGGPFGHGGEGGRFFGRGDVKFALLELLQERPMHGYEMMKALAERSGGFYTPSPGSIYPTLQMLEEGGYVTSQEVEGKRVYRITDAGRALFAERQGSEAGFEGPPWMHRHGHGEHGGHRLEMQALRSEAMEVARLFAIAGRSAIQNPEQLARLRALLERTRNELTTLIYGETPAHEQSSASQSAGAPDVEQA